MSESTAPWYREGLCFECTRCGNCCTGFPGTVTVNDAEVEALASRLEQSVEDFRRRYTRVMSDGSVSLREKPNYDCVFWAREHGCLVYEDRPTQCRTWPFWRSNVESRERWDAEAEHCPGMNRGRLYTIDEIEERAAKTP
jgi:Fe-S-cluster containining protein